MKNYYLYLALALLHSDKPLQNNLFLNNDCGGSLEDRSFVEDITLCDFLKDDDKKACLGIPDNSVVGEYKNGTGFLPSFPNEANYLTFTYINIAILEFQTAKYILLEGYKHVKISEKDYQEIDKIITYQEDISQRVKYIEAEIAKDEKERIAGGFEKILLPSDLERQLLKLIGHPFKERSDSEASQITFIELLIDSYQIETNYPNAHLDRARTISSHLPMLWELAIEDICVFVSEQNNFPSYELANAYHLKATIWSDQKEKRNALTVLEEERNIREQGYEGLTLSSETQLFVNLVDTAVIYRDEGYIFSATEFLERASKEAVYAPAHVGLAYDFMKLKLYDKALQEIEKSISIDPDNAIAYIQEGYIIRQDTNSSGTKEERACFEKALAFGIQNDDNDVQRQAHGALCKYYFMKGESESALYHQSEHKRLRIDGQKEPEEK